MKLFLASPHTLLRFKEGYQLCEYILQGKTEHIKSSLQFTGGTDMIVFLAGGVSGNLKPAWQRTAKRPDISLNNFTEDLINENFWQGGSPVTGSKTRLRL